MADSNTKKANAYLQTDSYDLRLLFAKIKVLQELQHKVATYLEPNIASYCQVANLIGQRLVILVANGSIATQLRFQQADLLKKLKADPDPRLQAIQDIHCKVHPGLPATPPRSLTKAKQKMEPLSADTAQLIDNLADSLTDPALKEIMKKIAGRRSKR